MERAPIARIPIFDLIPEASGLHPEQDHESGISDTSIDAQAVSTVNSDVGAICEGAPINLGTRSYRQSTLIDVLAAAADGPHGVIFIEDDGAVASVRYKDIFQSAHHIAQGLVKNGVRKGHHVVLCLENRQSFVEAFWACQLIGATVIPVALATDLADLEALASFAKLCERLDSPKVVCASEALVRSIAPSAHGLLFQVLKQFERIDPDNIEVFAPTATALMLLTSGSTGEPKLVTQNHETILARSQATWQHDEFNANDVSLNFLPLDHVGGLVMFHIRDVWTACEQIQASMSLVLENPLVWLDWVNEYRVTVTWAPNFAFALVNSHEESIKSRNWDLSCLRFILNGGERIVANDAEKFIDLLKAFSLPSRAMRPAWGMSETCSGITSSAELTINDTSLPVSVSVGPPIPGVSLRIVNEQGDALLRYQEGELEVKGPTITPGYYHDDELNRQSFSADGWFKTGDLAMIDAEGCLHITGRSKQVMIVNGRNISLTEIESLFEAAPVPNTNSITAIVEDLTSGEESLVLVFGYQKAGDFSSVIAEINRRVLTHFSVSPTSVFFAPYSEIPRSSIGKVDRKTLKSLMKEGSLNHYCVQSRSVNTGSHTIPNAFFEKRYHSLAFDKKRLLPKNKHYVIVANSLAQANEFIDGNALDSTLCSVVFDRPEYEKVSESVWACSLSNKQHYIQAFASLGQVDCVFHLGGLTSGSESEVDDQQLLLTRSVISLAQALAQIRVNANVVISTRHGQNVTGNDRDDSSVDPAKATLVGLIEVLNREVRGCRFKLVDLDGLNFKDVGQVYAQNYAANVVALRQNKAYRFGIAPVDIEQSRYSRPPFAPGEMVLITGGLGGVAFEIAKQIIQRYKVSLFLVGRSALPPEDTWPMICAEGGDKALRVQRLQALKKLGDVSYAVADIAEEESLAHTVAEFERKRYVQISGAIHTAGVLAAGDIAGFNDLSLDVALKAKREGSKALYSLFSSRDAFKFIVVSSTTGFFGGSGLAAYSVANAYQNALFEQMSGCQTWMVNYGRWDDTGLAAGRSDQEALLADGYLSLKPLEASQALLAVIERSPRNMIYGLASQGITISKYLEASGENSSTLVTDATEESSLVKTLSMIFKRVLETNDELDFNANYFDYGIHSLLIPQLKKQIFDETGCDVPTVEFFKAMSIVGLAEYIAGDPSQAQKLNASQKQALVSEKITQIFLGVLEMSEFDQEENYFDLGVHSLLIPQLKKQIFESTQCDIPTVEFFRAMNIANLSKYVVEHADPLEDEALVNVTDDLTRRVTKIFEQVLEIDDIPASENYFDLGVHSLLIPQLKKQILETTGCDVPTVEFFKAMNIATLVNFIKTHSDEAPECSLEDPQDIQASQDSQQHIDIDSSVVTIKSGGSKQPLFLIHDGDGETMLYTFLADSLDPGRPVYGIRPHSDGSLPILHTRLAEMAAHYIEMMRTVQKNGPYLIGGLCAGGVLAFEMACQLQAKGEEVSLVALLDAADDQTVIEKSWHSHKRRNRIAQTLQQSSDLPFQRKLAFLASSILQKLANAFLYETKNKINRLSNYVKVRLYRHYLDKGLAVPKFLQNIPVRIIYQFAVQESYPEIYQGDVVLFRATETLSSNDPSIDDTPNIDKHDDPLFGWGKRVQGNVIVHDVPGGHSSCLYEPQVKALADKLESYVRQSS